MSRLGGSLGGSSGGVGGMLGNLGKQFGMQSLLGGLSGGDDSGEGGLPANPMQAANNIAGGVLDTIPGVAEAGFNAMLPDS